MGGELFRDCAMMYVFCPLEVERKAVVRALRRGGKFIVHIERTGPGAAAVEHAVRRIGPRAAWYVLAGVAGGLREGIGGAPGIGRVVDGRGGEWRPTIGAGEAVIAGVDDVVATPEDKRSLRETTGADLVDTESHGFARVCAELGVEWGIVRGVSDGVDDALPREVAGWVDEAGRTRTGRVIVDLARRPAMVREVAQLGRRSGAAMRVVGERIAALAAAQLDAAWKEVVPPVVMREGTAILFGGSFDPPHRGHVELPERVRREVERRTGKPAWLIYVPAGRSPFKADLAPAPASDRLWMIEVAVERNPRAVVAPVEIQRAERGGEEVSYTVDTVRWARAELPREVKLRLLIGADQAAEFHRWKEPRAIIELAEPLVMLRGSEGAEELIEAMLRSGFWSEEELAAWRGRVVDVGTMDLSATEVRGAVRRGEWERVEGMVGGEVARVIRERGLYQA